MRAFAIKRSDIDRCPIRSLSAEHYNDDGSCRCCPTCHGTGRVPGEPWNANLARRPGYTRKPRSCGDCAGKGEVS